MCLLFYGKKLNRLFDQPNIMYRIKETWTPQNYVGKTKSDLAKVRP